MRILVVEDDPAIGMLIDKMSGPDHQVIVVETYDKAVEASTLQRFDAAFVDLLLGAKDEWEGVRTAKYLHKAGVHKITIVTGATDEVLEKVRIPLYGIADGYVRKPFTVPEILRALGAVPVPARIGEPA